MLYAKFQDHMKLGSGEKVFFQVLTIYGQGGHLGHLTKIIFITMCPLFSRRLHIKFGFDWLCVFARRNGSLKIMVIYMFITPDNTMGSNIYSKTKIFCHFGHLLQICPIK